MRELRKTLRGTAAEAKISPSLLSLVVQDKHVPSRKVIVALATTLNSDRDHWCGLAGRISPEAEATLAKIASEQPEFFRNLKGMIERAGGPKR